MSGIKKIGSIWEIEYANKQGMLTEFGEPSYESKESAEKRIGELKTLFPHNSFFSREYDRYVQDSREITA